MVNDHYNEISLRNSDYLKSEAYNLRTLQTAAVNHVSKIAGNYFGVLEKEIKRDARIYGKKRTKTNIALKPKKRMAKQKTHTHMEFKKPCDERPEVMIRKPIGNATKKGGGERAGGRCGGMNRSIYNECICTHFGQETRL